MIAVDTNVVVRYLVGDDPDQTARARALVERGGIVVGTTVLLETEWVLRGTYGHSAKMLVAVLRAFLGLPGVAVEEPRVAAQALEWAERGLDFADAVHLATASGCESFASFDRRLARAANRLSGVRVMEP